MLEYNMDLELVQGESGRKFFGGINSNQYTKRFILQKGEHPECYELECDKDLWKVMVEESANNIAVGRTEREKTNEKCLHQSIFDRRYKRQ